MNQLPPARFQEDVTVLFELERQIGVLRDRVRDVVARRTTSFYLFGPRGTSKTHIVRTTLDSIGEPYEYHAGHLTPMGFFDLLGEYSDDVLVLDDVLSLFRDRIGQQLLLAALGTQYSGDWTRVVKYRRRNREEVVNFSGGLIAISNIQLHDDDVMGAIKSRTKPLEWAPTDLQLAAMMRDAVKAGWARDGVTLTADECIEVVEFLIEQCRHYNVRLDLRLLFNGALPDFVASKIGEHETDWRDHTVFAIREQARRLQYSGPAKTRDQVKELEQKIVQRIRASHNTRPEQVEAWQRETGKSERAFDRRSAELRLAK